MSILAQLELNEASEVDFGIEIHGTTETSSEIRFIIEGPQYGILCRCTEANGVITASIPKLKGILPAGTFDAKLEVVVDGKFFMPLKESIEFKPMVEFDIHSTKAKPAQGPTVQTKNVTVRVLEQKPEPEAAPEEIAEVVKPKPKAKVPAPKAPRAPSAPAAPRAPMIEEIAPVVEAELVEIEAPLETQFAAAIEPTIVKPAVDPRKKDLLNKIRALKEQIGTLRKP